jgi:ABC-2 type transport system permease protein
MRAFSEERKMGTLELLLTKPISVFQIIMGKYIGAMLLIIIALLPTLLYVVTISDLGNPSGNWDVGSTLGSYIGLLFLTLVYAAVGMFASTLSKNQIVAFIAAVFLCFVLYCGFEGVSSMSSTLDVTYLGIQSHYNSVSRGVIDTRDLIYFLSVIVLFLVGTHIHIKQIGAA